MKTHRICTALVLVGALSACGEPVDEGTLAEDNEIAASANANAVVFRKDFTQSQRGTLAVGKTLGIEYDAARLPGCRGNLNNGQPAWTITGYVSVNRGPAKSFWVAGFSPTGSTAPPTLKLTEGGDHAFWFQITNRWGCSSYDSSFGKNYHFTVKPN